MPRPTPPPPPRKATKVTWEDHTLDGLDVSLKRRIGPATDLVPKVNPDYVFREELVAEVAYGAFNPRPTPIMLLGPKGSGKTSLITQVAARCNVECFRLNLNVGTTVRHLKGHRGAKPGQTVFFEGVAVQAMERGAWLILDELSGATPPVALSLFPILESDGAVFLEDAEPPRYVNRHPDFRVFATDNVIGAGQEDSRFAYGGTNPDVNEALLDRFGGFVEVGYLPPRLEANAVKAIVPECEDILLEMIVRLMNHLRSSSIDFSFSMRMTINWAQRVAYGYPGRDHQVLGLGPEDMLKAARAAFLNGMRSKLDRDAATEIITRMFPESPGGAP